MLFRSRFALTVLASRRARELSEGHGSPLVDCDNKEAVTALREVSADGVRFTGSVDEAIASYITEQRRTFMRSVDGDHTFLDAASFSMGAVSSAGDDVDDDEDDEEDDTVKELTGDLTKVVVEASDDDEDTGELEGVSEQEEEVDEDAALAADVNLGDDDDDDDDDDDAKAKAKPAT